MNVPRVALATKNPGKVREIASILADADAGAVIELIAPDPDWLAPDEPFDTYRENAILKARSLVAHMGIPCIADDSGIEVDALDGAPGPRSARFAGDDATDEQNLTALVAIVARTPLAARTARYRCVAVLIAPGGDPVVTEGVVEGTLLTERRGRGGFGYDPIFVPVEDPAHTMAELTPREKDAISHRGKAFRALIPALRAIE